MTAPDTPQVSLEDIPSADEPLRSPSVALPPTLSSLWLDGELVGQIIDDRRPLLTMDAAGLGAWFDQILGGGIAPGEMLGIGAAGAGVGKTALAHQMADGWAKASWIAWEGAQGSGHKPRVTPVLYVTEMSARGLTIRTLAREAGVPGKYLRALGYFENVAATVAAKAGQAAGRFAGAARFITPVDRAQAIGAGPAAVAALGAMAEQIRRNWEDAGAEVQAVVVVIDPVHRLLPGNQEETAALGDTLGKLLSVTQERGFVTVFTSDTTKAASAGRNNAEPADLETEAEQAFRGSYQLLHMPDHAIALQVLDPAKPPHKVAIEKAGLLSAFERRTPTEDQWATVFAHLPSPKLRWGQVGDRPAFWYDRALFRFVPIPRPPKYAAANMPSYGAASSGIGQGVRD